MHNKLRISLFASLLVIALACSQFSYAYSRNDFKALHYKVTRVEPLTHKPVQVATFNSTVTQSFKVSQAVVLEKAFNLVTLTKAVGYEHKRDYGQNSLFLNPRANLTITKMYPVYLNKYNSTYRQSDKISTTTVAKIKEQKPGDTNSAFNRVNLGSQKV
jgi:hypothetical protein